MVDSSVTEMQKAFIDGLNKQLQDNFSKQLDGTFQTMNVPQGFYWGLQFGPNNYYNKNSLNEINMQAIVGSNGIHTIGGANFTTLYNGIMTAVVFDFSEQDTKSLNDADTANEAQIQAVINGFETDMGAPITQSQQDGAMPPTKLGYIQSVVQSKFGGVADNIPNTMQGFKNAYSTYQVDAQVSNRLTLESAGAMNRLKAARNNSMHPKAENGGLQIAAAAYYQPFGPFPTQNKINGDLETTTNTASVKVKLDNFSSNESHFSVSGSTGFSIPILDFINIGVSGGASYTVDKYASSSTVINTTITYEGITFVSTGLTDSNLNTELTTGWYANDVLSAAIANATPNGGHPPKTGYTLAGGQYPVDEYFGPDKKFSMVKTWVLSQQPTIEMQVCGAEASKVATDFKEHSSVSVKLFGLFDIGHVDQSYEVKTVDNKSVAGCTTLTMGPQKVVGTTPGADLTAYVVGGVPSYPPNNI